MRYLTALIVTFLVLSSCENSKRLDAKQLRTGTFETLLEESDVVSTAVRNDSIQIETYDGVQYKYEIEWKSNFEYVLKRINPKKGLDSVPFHVKITGIKGNEYTFKANYRGSNFKQKGKAIKVKD